MGVFLVERGQVAAKIEGTGSSRGTLAAPVAADAGLYVYDIGVTHNIEVAERETQEASLDKPAGIPNNRSTEVTFRSEFVGHEGGAGVEPNISVLLRGCGLAVTVGATVSWAPRSDDADQESITLDVFRDGIRHRLTGAMGNAVLVLAQGEVPVFEFTFMGVYNEPVDASLLTNPPYPSVSPNQPLNATLTLMSQTMCATGFRYDLGNAVEMRQAITEATGFKHAIIVNRDPTITLDPEEELVATFNFKSKLTAGTIGEFVFSFGSVAGNTWTLTCPAAQIVEGSYGDRNSQVTHDLTLRPRKLANAGDDHMSLVLS